MPINLRLRFNMSCSLLLFFSIFIIILHPYTIYGKPGIIVAGIYAMYAIKKDIGTKYFYDFIIPIFMLLTISLFGALSSVFNGIPQFLHPSAVISLLIVVLASKGLYLHCIKLNVSQDKLLFWILLTIVINSTIVLIELQYDSIRQFIEAYLVKFEGGAINYAEGYRLRGVASSGGAGLSISVPAALIIAAYLFNKGFINSIFLILITFILLASVVVIGRTGIILLVIPAISYFFLLFSKGNGGLSVLRKHILLLLFVLMAPILYQLIFGYYMVMFDEAFVKYAFEFLLEGRSGIAEEGTAGMILEFIGVFPNEFPQVITGYGFYGGSYFYPWTDAGFNRTFLSVGLFFGTIFYLLLYRMYLLSFFSNRILFGSFVLLLTAAEIKEPLLYSGVASRMFIIFLIYSYFEKNLNNSLSVIRGSDSRNHGFGGP